MSETSWATSELIAGYSKTDSTGWIWMDEWMAEGVLMLILRSAVEVKSESAVIQVEKGRCDGTWWVKVGKTRRVTEWG
ncbi:hypothetical protein BJ165DRAFT_1503384 [Panaeolus papilionaceus]|nr:hypothetical protein BJ165DRAFT_1503384 [Panaeolus papilionaceus]